MKRVVREAVLIAIISASRCNGTEVIAQWSPQRIVIGVDGKGTYVVNRVEQPVKSCKALERNETVFVAAGAVPVNLREFVMSMTDAPGLVRDIESALRQKMRRLQREDPTRYSIYLSGRPIFTLYAAHRNVVRTVLTITPFVLSSNGSVAGKSQTMDGTNILVFARPNIKLPAPPDWNTHDPVDYIRNAFRVLFSQSDPSSGPPATIVRITPKEITWLDRGNCTPDGRNAFDTVPQ